MCQRQRQRLQNVHEWISKTAVLTAGVGEHCILEVSSRLCQIYAYSCLTDRTPIPDRNADYNQVRRYRTAFTKEQITRLEKEFAKENYISRPKRCELAASMNLPESTIKVGVLTPAE